jgi:hypothetical protein
VSAATDLPAGEAEQGQDRTDDEHDDADRPENGDLAMKPMTSRMIPRMMMARPSVLGA